MNTIEIIDKRSISMLDGVAMPLAVAYREAFAGPPWFERSRCVNNNCDVQFSADLPGCTCSNCGETLLEAYESGTLIDSWRSMIINDNATMEITKNTESVPYLATLARPTTPQEIFERKYSSVPAMKAWIAANLPIDFVWIEDTFANRLISPSRNLDRRGETLAKIALTYGNIPIATRTLASAVIRATLRDTGDMATVYLGSANVGADLVPDAVLPGRVPDYRTLIRVDSV